VEPLAAGEGFLVENGIRGDVIPKEFIEPTLHGAREALENGVLAGYQLMDVKVTLIDGSFHDQDSSEVAFKIAGSMAVKEALREASPRLMEPIAKLEVVTPEDYVGSVIGDLNSRRGKVSSMDPRGNVQVIKAVVPIAEMFGYATDLRSVTQGRASFTLEVSHFEQLPEKSEREILIKLGRIQPD